MNVTLIDYTGKGCSPSADDYAAGLLLAAKSTRLEMSPEAMESFRDLPKTELLRELQAVADTIPSSWEFVRYTFLVQDVSRAFTHQFVRTRTGSYAQQTMRVLDKTGFGYATGPTIERDAEAAALYNETMSSIADAYEELVSAGVAVEDARGVLPTNITTNIMAAFSLRDVVGLWRKRALSPRVQDEYRSVVRAMVRAVRAVHPWTFLFLDRSVDELHDGLSAAIEVVEDAALRTRLAKLADAIRTEQAG